MNLIRMLAKARSLMGVGQDEARYEVVQENLVPRFNRSGSGPALIPEEPMGAGPGRERGEGGGQVLGQEQKYDQEREQEREPSLRRPANVQQAELKMKTNTGVAMTQQDQPGSRHMAAPMSEREASGTVSASGTGSGSGSGSASHSLSHGYGHGRWLNRPFASRPVLKADAKGQLSLEFVKVVRNDLSDSDLELVPTRNGGVQPVRVPAQNAIRRAESNEDSRVLSEAGVGAGAGSIEPEASRWSRFRSRLFGAGVVS